eukprot:SAG31_NODE_13174_length_887_cov_2.794416_1_plen_204_part_00
MSWAPTSTQSADTSTPQSVSINAINAERETPQTDTGNNKRHGEAAAGRAQQSWCPRFESRTTHRLLPPHHTACHGHRQAHSPWPPRNASYALTDELPCFVRDARPSLPPPFCAMAHARIVGEHCQCCSVAINVRTVAEGFIRKGAPPRSTFCVVSEGWVRCCRRLGGNSAPCFASTALARKSSQFSTCTLVSLRPVHVDLNLN